MKKYRLSIFIVILAVVTWMGIFFLAAPKEEAPLEFVPRHRPKQEQIMEEKKTVLPPVDHLAVIFDGKSSTAEQIKSVSLLGDSLSSKEVSDVLHFIRTSPNGDAQYVIKNNLMNQLLKQKTLSPDLSRELIGMARDKNQNIVVRIYALQHLRPLYENTRDASIKSFFYEALKEEDTEISGGAMLALNYLSIHEDYAAEFDREPVINQAIKIALDDNANNNSRITAIQIASASAAPNLVDGLRKIVSDESTHAALRISAIAGLGALGDDSDLATLQTIADGKRFEKRAALVAINKITYRQGLSK